VNQCITPESAMVIRTPQLPQLNLSRNQFDQPFFVDMESFFEFSFWVSEELLDLEFRFKPKNLPRLQSAKEFA
jgi:hypothetical protein